MNWGMSSWRVDFAENSWLKNTSDAFVSKLETTSHEKAMKGATPLISTGKSEGETILRARLEEAFATPYLKDSGYNPDKHGDLAQIASKFAFEVFKRADFRKDGKLESWELQEWQNNPDSFALFSDLMNKRKDYLPKYSKILLDSPEEIPFSTQNDPRNNASFKPQTTVSDTVVCKTDETA
jgi:hypothetical protein